MSGWNRVATSVGLVLLAGGTFALYVVATAGRVVAWYWWVGSLVVILLGTLIVVGEVYLWARGQEPPR